MKKLFLIGAAIALIPVFSTPVYAEDRNAYIQNIRAHVASDPELAAIEASDSIYLMFGLSNCTLLREGFSLRTVIIEAMNRAGRLRSCQKAQAISIKYGIRDLCPDQKYKLKNENAR